jgi:hypothetical protein
MTCRSWHVDQAALKQQLCNLQLANFSADASLLDCCVLGQKLMVSTCHRLFPPFSQGKGAKEVGAHE